MSDSKDTIYHIEKNANFSIEKQKLDEKEFQSKVNETTQNPPDKPKKKKKKPYNSFIGFKDYDSKGELKTTIANLQALLKYLDIEFRYNETLREIDAFEGGRFILDDITLDSLVAFVKSESAVHDLSRHAITEYLTNIAEKNKYNPIADWIHSRDWDGVSRIQELVDTVQTDNNKLRDLLMRKWLIGCVAAIFNPDFWCKSVLIFQGDQSLAKSSWFKRLVPKNMFKYITDGFGLDTDSKDSIQQASSSWLVELAEIDQTFLKHPAKLKAYFSRTVDKYRPPYARTSVAFKRKTMFFGSANHAEFLKDLSGNTRYWCLAVRELNHKHDIDMQQVFAEAYQYYTDGENWWLNAEQEAELAENNEKFTVTHTLHEKILELFDISVDKQFWSYQYTATQILQKMGYGSPTVRHISDASILLTKMFDCKKTNKGKKYLTPDAKQYNYMI